MQGTVTWEELGIEANKDGRREARIPLTIPIEVTGFDIDGKFFCEATKTVDVSESGCRFRLKRCLERGGVVAIKVAAKDRKKSSEVRPLLYQIARAAAEGQRWIIGAAKLQPESVWFVAFPKPETDARSQGAGEPRAAKNRVLLLYITYFTAPAAVALAVATGAQTVLSRRTSKPVCAGNSTSLPRLVAT